jgi:anaerobic magnesium-protoporphyrin IX monomethyl ester cyclase
MKILLIYPYFLEERVHVEEIRVLPQGIFFVAALCRRHGHDVEILNWHDIHRRPQEIRETLKKTGPDIIGFSILHANRWGGIDIAGIAREIDPAVHIVFGGIGATYLWEHLLANFDHIDYVVLGEGEVCFLELIRCLETGRLSDIPTIRGLALRRDGKPVCTEPAQPVAGLDTLPNPARFFTYQHVSLTRGCPGNCTFCGSPGFWHRRVRFHSAAYFVEQLELLNRKGVRHFYFCDDTLTVNSQKVVEVCRLILARGLDITWQAISRVDMINEEILYWMRKAGCIQISFGVESGSEKIRRLLNKTFTTAQIEQAFSLTNRYGILSRAYFIYGCPGESRETIQESIELMRRIKPLGAVFYILDLFPGTALYDVYRRLFGVTDDIWLERVEDILYFETDPKLDQDQVLSFGRMLRTAFHENLPDCVRSLELVEQKDLYPLHADFLSRLAMTFDQGDYAAVEAIPNKPHLAEFLYRKALSYHPDPRAFLGLGILLQKAGRHAAARDILKEAVRHFPDHAPLNISLGISLLKLGQFDSALTRLLPFQNDRQVLRFIMDCYKALGDRESAARCRDKLQEISSGD